MKPLVLAVGVVVAHAPDVRNIAYFVLTASAHDANKES